MNIIGGLIEGENQKIVVDEKELFVDENFGYVFQTSRLFPWLTVRENIELFQITTTKQMKELIIC